MVHPLFFADIFLYISTQIHITPILPTIYNYTIPCRENVENFFSTQTPFIHLDKQAQQHINH